MWFSDRIIFSAARMMIRLKAHNGLKKEIKKKKKWKRRNSIASYTWASSFYYYFYYSIFECLFFVLQHLTTLRLNDNPTGGGWIKEYLSSLKKNYAAHSFYLQRIPWKPINIIINRSFATLAKNKNYWND